MEALLPNQPATAQQPMGLTPIPAPTHGTIGHVVVLDNRQLSAREQAEQAEAQQQEQARIRELESQLAGHIAKRFQLARDARQTTGVDLRLLRAQRMRKGEYEPDIFAAITEQGGSRVYVMLTEEKCAAAEAMIGDILGTEVQFSLTPTPVSDLPPDLQEQVVQRVIDEHMARVMAAGQPLMAQTMDTAQAQAIQQELMQNASDLRDLYMAMMRTEAKRRAAAMEERIHDTLEEGNWLTAQEEAVSDLATFGTAVIEGPIIRQEEKLGWGRDNQPTIHVVYSYQFERIEPMDCYPSPDATNPQEGDFIRRMRWTRDNIQKLKGLPGVDDAAVDRVLAGPMVQVQPQQPTDATRRWLSEHPNWYQGELIEGHKYFGTVPGDMLIRWGMKADNNGQPMDPQRQYHIQALKLAGEVVMVRLNPDPLGRRPLAHAQYRKVKGSFWGKGVPHLMEDIQDAVNSTTRALMDNMGLSSGPQMIINDINRIPSGSDIESIHPRKIWQFVSAPGQDGKPLDFFLIPSNAEVLLRVLNDFMAKADARTGIPSYQYSGESAKTGAGATYGGLSLLMNSASRGMKKIVSNIDVGLIRPAVEYVYVMLMLFDPDESIKGDAQIVVRGALGMMVREQRQNNLVQFLQMTANPADAISVTPEHRRNMLEALAKHILDIPPEKAVSTAEELKQRLQAMIPPMIEGESPQGPAPGGGPGAPTTRQPAPVANAPAAPPAPNV